MARKKLSGMEWAILAVIAIAIYTYYQGGRGIGIDDHMQIYEERFMDNN
jgi:hypothetical protein